MRLSKHGRKICDKLLSLYILVNICKYYEYAVYEYAVIFFFILYRSYIVLVSFVWILSVLVIKVYESHVWLHRR